MEICCTGKLKIVFISRFIVIQWLICWNDNNRREAYFTIVQCEWVKLTWNLFVHLGVNTTIHEMV